MKPTRAVFGFHAVLARLRADPGSIAELYLDETRKDARAKDLVAVAQKAGVEVMRVPTRRLDGFYGGGRHQGVVALVREAGARESLEALLERLAEPALLLVLDGVTDPHNLGACLRVADAAGAHAVIAPRDRAAGITPVVSKVASGAAESLPYHMVTNLARTLDDLKERGIWIVGADERAPRTLYQERLPEGIAWVLGAEGEGMRRLTRERCDLVVRVPMLGQVQSLNVSVASALCLFESVRRRLAARPNPSAPAGVSPGMATQPAPYMPPDPTVIEAGDPRALDFWSSTLGKPQQAIREAVEKVGPLLEHVKRELGIAGE